MEGYIRMMLDETERLFSFPFPLKAAGYYPGELNVEDYPPMKENMFYFRDEYQFSLRLTSPVQTLCNVINGVEYINTFPHVIMKCPGHIYYNDYPFKSPNSLCIHYDRKQFHAFFEKHCAGEPLAWNVTLTPAITELVHKITEKLPYSQNYSVADKLDLLAFQLLEELLLYRKNTTSHQLNVDKFQKIQKIASYIQLNYNRNIDLNELIAANQISRSTFFRLWNSVHEESPLIYQNNLRMKEAERLLLETENSVQTISNQLGYSSPAYFGALFKKKNGMPPAEFSRKYKQESKLN